MYGGEHSKKIERYMKGPLTPYSAHARHYYRRSLVFNPARNLPISPPRARCLSASKVMDSNNRSASPRESSRPQQKPPSPPLGVDNRAYLPDQDDPNHNQPTNDSFASNTSPQTNGKHDHNGEAKAYEAVNLELINLNPKNGNVQKPMAVKKEVEIDMNASNPYDEYFVPVNEHRKYMRGEKLYVTADKRNEKGGCKRPLCWSLLGLVVAAVVILIVLAATGILFTNTPTPVEDYNSTISSARAFGIGGADSQKHKNHELSPNDGQNVYEHDHTGQVYEHEHHNHDHSLHNKEDNSQNQDENVEMKHISREPNFRSLDEVDDQNQHERDRTQSDQMHDPNVLVDDMNDSALYIPRTIEGELKIDNEQFQTEYEDIDSNSYKEFTSTLSEAIRKAIFDKDKSDDDFTVEIVKLKRGSVIVTYRIHWKPKTSEKEASDPITSEITSKKLSDYLNKNGRMLNIYHVAEEQEILRPVLNICQVNNNNCEHGCEFDYATLDFKCTCPSGKILHMDNLKTCISLFDENSNTKVISFDSNQSTSKPTPNEETPATENVYLLSDNKHFDWKETSHLDETTTQEIPNVHYSHIFGHPHSDSINESNEAKSEPQPEPEPKSEPTAQPSSEPSAESEPTSEPETKLKPLSEPEPSSEQSAELEPTSEPESKLKSLAESEPSAEPEPTSEPESKLKPLAEPEPTVLPEPTAEPTSTPEPKSEPSAEPEPKSEPMLTPQPEPTSEPKSEPIPTTEPLPQSEPSPQSEPASQSESTIKSEPVTYLGHQTFEPNPTSEPTAEPTAEPTTEPAAEPEPVPDLESIQNQSYVAISNVTKVLNQESNKYSTIINSETNFNNETHKENNSEEDFNVTSNIMHESIDDLIIKTNMESKNINTDATLIFTTMLPEITYQMDELDTDTSVIGLHPIEQRDNKMKDNNVFFDNKENFVRNESRPRSFNFDFEPAEEAKTEQTTEESKEDTITFDFITNNEDNVNKSNTDTKFNPITTKSTFTEIMEAVHETGNKMDLSTQIPDLKKNYTIANMSIETTTHSLDPGSMSDNQDIVDEMMHIISNDSKYINYTTQLQLINDKENVSNAKNHTINNETTKSPNNATSKLFEESTDITFDTISNVNDTDKLDTTEKEFPLLEQSTVGSTETMITSTTDSEWLSEPVSEDILNGDHPLNEQLTTTEFTIPISEDMSPINAKEDFDNEYLNNFALGNRMNEQDVPMYAMPSDYENEEARVKRVNKEFKGVNNSNNIDIIKSTTVSQYIFKSNETNNVMKIDGSSPAPVWESAETDAAHSLRSDNNKLQIDHYDTNTVTKSLSNNTTQASNLNVTIYEISNQNNNSLQTSKSDSNIQSISYVDHETEMNPFLPEIENNKHLVTKLQEGHDVETTNYNETIIASSQEQRTNDTVSSETTSSKEPPTTTFSINSENTEDQQSSSNKLEQNKHENDFVNSPNEENISTEFAINSNTEKSSDNNYIPISTFLIDTADLPSGKELTTTEGKVEVDSTSEFHTSTTKFVNGEDYLNVVPIKQDKHKSDIETLYNDINDTPKKSDKRTISKLQSVIDNEA